MTKNPGLAQADNPYAGEVRDDALSEKFADILRRRDALDSEFEALRLRQRALQAELNALGGLAAGDIVNVEDGRQAQLNSVTAEPFIVPRGNVIYLRLTGECSPLTAAGSPSKREMHKRFRHVRWHIEAPLVKSSNRG